MALQEPVYTFNRTSERITEFKGYNARSIRNDGEMRDMSGLSSNQYPCLSQRTQYSVFNDNLINAQSMISKSYIGADGIGNALAVIIKDTDNVYRCRYRDVTVPNIALSANTQMVSINDKICFFPEKKFYKINTGEIGNIEATYISTNISSIDVYSNKLVFNGASGLADKFNVGDVLETTLAANASGIKSDTEGVSGEELQADIETSAEVISEIGNNYILFQKDISLLPNTAGVKKIQATGISMLTLKRKCPDLDYVIEWNNRLWGCSNKDNTIYASKLGDPTNWQYYQSTSIDSYFAQQGSDGRWTGVGKYSTHLLFFKEDCVHKVYGNYPSEFQIITQMCSGVKEGSSKSVVTMEDGVLYHSRRGIMGYSGGIPTLLSTEFGNKEYHNATAGTDGRIYYVSLLDANNLPSLFAYDSELGLWHKYSDTYVRDFEWHNGKLHFIDDIDASKIFYIDNNVTDDVMWHAEFGPFDEWIEEHKIYSKVKIRYKKYGDATLNVELSIDEGAWETVQLVTSENENSGFIEFVPERCDRFSIRLSGSGRCEIKSITREFRQGTMAKENY